MITWGYVAGFFDGEGNLNFTGRRFPVPNMSQAGDRGLEILTQIRDFLSSHGIRSVVGNYDKHTHLGEEKAKRYKKAWRLLIEQRESAVRFLESIIPFLCVKRASVQDTLRYHTLFPPLRKNKFWLEERVKLMTLGRQKSMLEVL